MGDLKKRTKTSVRGGLKASKLPPSKLFRGGDVKWKADFQ